MRAVANSPLFKTAMAGSDSNWGRIIMAIGKSGVRLIQKIFQLNLEEILLIMDKQKTLI